MVIDDVMFPNTITPQRMAYIENNAEKLGLPRIILMENAGNAVSKHMKALLDDANAKSVIVVAGTGNNGGDGFVAARHLSGEGARVEIVLLGTREAIKTKEAFANWAVVSNMAESVTITAIHTELPIGVRDRIQGADGIVDAIFGTGIRGIIREPHSTVIDAMNSAAGKKLAVDIPSGLDPLTGEVHDKAFRADLTLSFHQYKVGLVGRREYTGDVLVERIGIPPEAEKECP